MFLKFLEIVLLGTGALAAVHLPHEIHKCSRSDPEFTTCMAKSMTEAIVFFKGGSKDFGFQALEPYRIKKLEIAADPGKSVSLYQEYENVKMYGLITSKVEKLSIDEDGKNDCKWNLEVHTPGTRMEADYTLTGQILLFPVNANGKCNVTLTKIVNMHRADCERYMKNGKSHLRLKNYSMNMTVEKCEFQFSNLFPGNEQISKELEKTINENSLEIFQEVKGGFEQMLSKLHENAANSVFFKIPEDELFLP